LARKKDGRSRVTTTALAAASTAAASVVVKKKRKLPRFIVFVLCFDGCLFEN